MEARSGRPLSDLRDVVVAIGAIPYARPSRPTAEAVVEEWRGTCSGKHLLLEAVLAERFPDHHVALWHRAYLLSRKDAERRWGREVAEAVPQSGVADVHTYAVVSTPEGEVVIDVTFPVVDWDGRSDMPVHCGPGDDVPVGPDPLATKAALVAERCDATTREAFIAALARIDERRRRVDEVLTDQIPLFSAMGVVCEEVGERRIRLRLPFAPINANHVGTVYAGASYSFAEVGAGLALALSLPDGWIPVMVEGSIAYTKPLMGDAFVEVDVGDDQASRWQQDVLADRRARVTVPVEVIDADGRTCATARMTYRVLVP